MILKIQKQSNWIDLYKNNYFENLLSVHNIINPNPTGKENFIFDISIFDKYKDYFEILEHYVNALVPSLSPDTEINVFIIPGDIISEKSFTGVTKTKLAQDYNSQSYILFPFNFDKKDELEQDYIIHQTLATILHECLHQAINKSNERQDIISYCKINNINKKMFVDIEEYMVESIIKNSNSGIIMKSFNKPLFMEQFGKLNNRNKILKIIISDINNDIINNNINYYPKLDVNLFLKIYTILNNPNIKNTPTP